MSKLDRDFSGLNQLRQLRRKRRRIAPLLICLPVFIGAIWLYSDSSAQPASSLTDSAPTQSVQLTATAFDQDASTQPKRDWRPAPASRNDVVAVRKSLKFEPGLRLASVSPRQQEMAAGQPARTWFEISIHKGDTLSTAFARYGLHYSDALAIARLPEHGQHFTTNLRAGDEFSVKADADGHVLALKDALSPARTLEVRAHADGFSAHVNTIELNRRIAYATGVIHNSFYQDALDSGLTPQQVMDLASLFKWEVDFAYGVRPGDRFTVVYSELYKDGRKVADGHILAASFQTRSQIVRALRFTEYENETNYYRPDGSSLKRAFIRTPVDYTRISSPFTLARDHPIMDTVRAHEGTDFAAPMGTPIHAAGDGRIVFRGRNGGYGNMIKINHGRGITTRYGHMSRFAAGQSVGTHVDQGEIIGYVGSTGLSTGPHLHYEFRIDGAPQNPETVDLPGAPPLPNKYMDEFKAHIEPLMAQLEAVSSTALAQNTHDAVVR